MSFFAKAGDQFSRVWLGSFYVIGLRGAAGVPPRRCSSLVRRWTREGRLTRRTAIVGGGAAGEALVAAIRDQRDTDVRVIGLFDDRGDDRSPQAVGRRRASSARSTTWSSSRGGPASIS